MAGADRGSEGAVGKLEEKLATAESLLYRRGNFNGTFDQLSWTP